MIHAFIGALIFVATDESGGATGKANLQTRKVPLYFMTHRYLKERKRPLRLVSALRSHIPEFLQRRRRSIRWQASNQQAQALTNNLK